MEASPACNIWIERFVGIIGDALAVPPCQDESVTMDSWKMKLDKLAFCLQEGSAPVNIQADAWEKIASSTFESVLVTSVVDGTENKLEQILCSQAFAHFRKVEGFTEGQVAYVEGHFIEKDLARVVKGLEISQEKKDIMLENPLLIRTAALFMCRALKSDFWQEFQDFRKESGATPNWPVLEGDWSHRSW